MMFAAVIALKAYSVLGMSVGRLRLNVKVRTTQIDLCTRIGLAIRRIQLTDLVQTTIVGKDSDVSVVCAG